MIISTGSALAAGLAAAALIALFVFLRHRRKKAPQTAQWGALTRARARVGQEAAQSAAKERAQNGKAASGTTGPPQRPSTEHISQVKKR